MSDIDEKTKRDIENGVPMIVSYLDENKNTTKTETYNLENVEIPDYALRNFARAILPDIKEFYSHEENAKKIDEWQKEHKKNRKKISNYGFRHTFKIIDQEICHIKRTFVEAVD